MNATVQVQLEDFDVSDEIDALTAGQGSIGAVATFCGYVRGDANVTMAKFVGASAAMPAETTLAAAPWPAWMEIYLSGLSADRRASAPSILQGLPANAMFIAAEQAGQAISSGLTIGDGRVASVQCMATAAAQRRRGGAQRALAAIEQLAANAGRDVLYLQTGADNTVAQALYRRCGFEIVGRYHVLTRTI